MSQQFSLKANHRDTYRLVPVGSTDPGDYIHSPTDPSGFAFFEAEPANYYVYCRPAYTGEFVLINSQVTSGYQYLRTVNPEIDSDGIISLASLVNNLTVYVDTENDNAPYVKKSENVSIRVLTTSGGVPSTGLQSAPDVSVYRHSGGSSTFHSLATYNSALYDTANPHIYHYTFTFPLNGEDIYFFRAAATYEGIESVDYPDAPWLQLDIVAPQLTSTNVLLSSSSANLADNMNNTSTASCFVSMPEASISDAYSGPSKIHLQPYIKSQVTDDAGQPGGLKYTSNTTPFKFEDQHLNDATGTGDNWDLSEAGGWSIVIGPDDNGNSYLYRNFGNAFGASNQFTLQNLGSTPTPYVEVSLTDLNSASETYDTGSPGIPAFTLNSYYQYTLFYYPIAAYCDGDPTQLNQVDCEAASQVWKSAETLVNEWPIEFAHGGNIVQNVLLTQSVPPGFVDDMEGVEYGFLVSASDRALNTNTQYPEFLKPSIVYDTVVELAPNLSWWFVKNQTDNESTAYVNEYGWFNTGAGLNQGVCSDAGETTQEGCCINGTTPGVWSSTTEVCSGTPSNTWTHDHLTLILQTVDNNQAQNTQFGVQVSFDGVSWTEYSQTGTNNLVGGTTSQYWINAEIKQGANTLYVRSLHADGNVTGNTYAIEYKWDKYYPTWTSAGNTTGTGGFNRAFFTWDQGPADYGTAASHYVGGGGLLEGTLAAPVEGFSLAHKIRIYRSKNAGVTPDDWDVVSAAPNTYDLVEIGLFPTSIQNYTDTSFHNVDYSDQYLDPFFYWGVPLDTAGNEGQGRNTADGVLLCPPGGITVTPLQPADVAGALGTETIIDPDNLKVIRTHRDIAVPTDGVIIRTNTLGRQAGLHKLSHSEDGYTYTNIPIVERLGESYVPIYINLSLEGVTSLNNGVQFPIIGKTPADLGIDHLVGYANPNGSGDLGVVHLRRSRCKTGSSSYVNGVVTKHSCYSVGGEWESVTNPVVLDSITEDATPTTYINLKSLSSSISDELDGSNGGAGELTDITYTVDIGMLLEDNTTYALGIEPIDNKYYYRTEFNATIHDGYYCTDSVVIGTGSADIHTCLCGTGGTWSGSACTAGTDSGWEWLKDINLDTDGINWSTKLAADLIVGGTLRLETGLSIWSGGYVDGEPTGTGISMDQVGLTMFNGADETIRLNSNDGSFAMGDLSNPAGNKLQFSPASGQLSLIGSLYQLQPDTGINSPEFAGNYILGTCSDQQYTTEEDCCIGDTGTWNGTLCTGGGGAVLWTDKHYDQGEVVIYNADYWICIADQDENEDPSPPSNVDDTHWSLYASSSMEGAAATSLSLAAESSTFIANENNEVYTPNDIRIVANASNISGDLTWSIEAVDTADADISGSINLYTDETCATPAASVLGDSTPVYLCAGNLNTNVAKSVKVTCSYTLSTDQGNVLQSLSDSIVFQRLTEGSSAYSIVLSEDVHLVAADEYGAVASSEWNNAFTGVTLYKGTNKLECTIASTAGPSSSNWGSVDSQANLPAPPLCYVSNSNTGDLSAEPISGYADIVVTNNDSNDPDYTNEVGTVRFVVTKQLAGTSSKTASLSASSQTYTIDPNSQAIVGPDVGTSEYKIIVDLQYPNISISNLAWTLSGSPAISGNFNISAYQPGDVAVVDNTVLEVTSNGSDPVTGAHQVTIHLAEVNAIGVSHENLSLGVTVTDSITGEVFTDNMTFVRLALGADAYVGNLSNDSYSVAADYTGLIENLSDAGGLFSVYRGTQLLQTPNVQFEVPPVWYARCWHDGNGISGYEGLSVLTLDNLATFPLPSQTGMVKWSDLGATSQINNTIYATDPGDNFITWATTFIRVDSNFSYSNLNFTGDNAHRLYINNAVPTGQNGGPVEDSQYNASDLYDMTFTTTGGWASPTDTANTGPWYKIDMLYYESGGGDHVALGFNPKNDAGAGAGGGAVIGEINATTGVYKINYFDLPHANQASLILTAKIDDDLDDVYESSIDKIYTISKSQAGSPGNYWKSLYHTSNQFNTVAAMETAMDLDANQDWPPDNPTADSLLSWITTFPPSPLPGWTTWETRKLYRTDGTAIEGEGWSTPGVIGSVPLDPIIYYIRPSYGTQLLNSENVNGGDTLEVVGIQQDQTNGDSTITAGGSIVLSTNADGTDDGGSDYGALTRSFNSDDITGSLTVYLVDTSTTAILDTISLIDVSDGIPVGAVTANPGLVFTESSGGSWSPGAIAITVKFYDSQGTVTDTGTITFDCDGSGLIDRFVDFVGANISATITGEGTKQVGMVFTHVPTNMSASETIYAVEAGQQGPTGDTGPAGPSITYTGGWDVNRAMYFQGDYSGENSDGEESTDPIGEMVRFDYNWPNNSKEWHKNNGEYFICKVEHAPEQALAPANNAGVPHAFWQKFGANYESVATGLLLAETVIAEEIFGENLILTDTFKIKSPGGSCQGISLQLNNLDFTGGMAIDDYGDFGVNDRGNWQIGKGVISGDTNTSARMRPHNRWADTEGGETVNGQWLNGDAPGGPIAIAINSEWDGWAENDGTTELLEALQPGMLMYFSAEAGNSHFSTHGAAPFILKIVEDPHKKEAGLPTGAYRSRDLHDKLIELSYPSGAAPDDRAFQFDVEQVEVDGRGVVSNTSTSSISTIDGEVMHLSLHVGAADEGDCIGLGGTWYPDYAGLDLSLAGMKFTNASNEQTIDLDANEGGFTFGVESSGQYIKYEDNQLQLHGQLFVDGGFLEEPARQLNLSSDVQMFGWELCSLSWEGSLLLDTPDTAQGAVFAGASWEFNLAQDGPILIRLRMKDANGEAILRLNQIQFGMVPIATQHDDAIADGNSRWYEFYSPYDPVAGSNTIDLIEGTANGNDSYVEAIQVFSMPTANKIELFANYSNLGTDPYIIWNATQVTPDGAPVSNIPLVDQGTGDSTAFASITLDDFVLPQVEGQNQWTVTLTASPGYGSEPDGNESRTIIEQNNVSAVDEGALASWSNGAVQSQIFAPSGIRARFRLVRDTGTTGNRLMAGLSYDDSGSISYNTIDYAIYRTASSDPDHDMIRIYSRQYSLGIWIAEDTNVTHEQMDNWEFKIEFLPLTSIRFFVDKKDDQGWQECSINESNGNMSPVQDSGIRFDTSVFGNSSSIRDISVGKLLVHSGNEFPLTSSAVRVTATATNSENGWSSDVFDSMTIVRGLAGSSGTDSVTATLSNESSTVPGPTTGSWTGSTSTDIKVYSGVTDVTSLATFSISSSSSWSTQSISGNTVEMTVIDSGYNAGFVVIEIIYGGVTLSKEFTVALAREGYQGIDGNPGAAQFLYDDLDGTGYANGAGRYQFMDIITANTPVDGINISFETANALLVNKTDTAGSDRSAFYGLLTAGSDFIFFVSPTRYYHFILTSDPVENPLGGYANRWLFNLQLVTHVAEDTTAIGWNAGDADVFMQFGVVNPNIRGSRTYADDVCNDISTMESGDGGSFVANTTFFDDPATTIASEGGGPVKRDIVNQFCEAQSHAKSKFFDGANWTDYSQVIDGNLVVDGTIHAAAIDVNAVTAEKIAAGAITTDKLSVGAGSGNLLGDKIPGGGSGATFAHLQVGFGTEYGGWQIVNEGTDADASATIVEKELASLPHLANSNSNNATKTAFLLTATGRTNTKLYSPWIPVSSSEGYRISQSVGFQDGAASGERASYYVGIHASSCDNPNLPNGCDDGQGLLQHRTMRKITNTSGDPFSEMSWSLTAINNNHYTGRFKQFDSAAAVSSANATQHGFVAGQTYDEFWVPMSYVLHPADAEEAQMKTGGMHQRTHSYMSALHADGAIGEYSHTDNYRMHPDTKWIRLRYRILQNDATYGESDNTGHVNSFLIAEPSVSLTESTMIDGGSIVTNSLTADHIDVSTLEVDVQLTANEIEAGSIVSANEKTFWSLDNSVFIVKDDSDVVRVKIGDLNADETITGDD